MSTVHDLQESIEQADRDKECAFWRATYREAFPTIIATTRNAGSSPAQRRGVDRLVHLRNDRIIRIEEKARSIPIDKYGDVGLEYVSVDSDPPKPGWIEKDLACDYLAYGWVPSRIALLFDWSMLKRAWRTHGRQWKREYDTRCARTKGRNGRVYKTWSCYVPIKVVRQSVAKCRRIVVPESV